MTVTAAPAAWPTTDEVMAARVRAGWRSPLAPLEPGEATCLFHSRGTYEFLVHPADAAHHLEHGLIVDGRLLDARQVDAFPLMNAILLQCRDPDAPTGFVDAADTARSSQ